MRLLTIALGGALGAVLRYWLSGWVQALTGPRFPWGTLTVNVLGSLLVGVAIGVTLAGTAGGGAWGRQFWGIGLLGAFTTYSTFSYETVTMLETGDWQGGIANVLLNLVLALGAVWIGLRVAGA